MEKNTNTELESLSGHNSGNRGLPVDGVDINKNGVPEQSHREDDHNRDIERRLQKHDEKERELARVREALSRRLMEEHLRNER